MKTCCCCFSLKTGSKCIAVYGLITSIVGLWSSIIEYRNGGYASNSGWLFWINAILVMNAVGAICLSRGLRTKTGSLLWIWLFLSLIRLLAQIGILIFLSVIFAELESIPTNGFDKKTSDLVFDVEKRCIIIMSAMCLDVLLSIYCMYAVNSYRIELETTDSDETSLLKHDVPAYDAEKVNYLA